MIRFEKRTSSILLAGSLLLACSLSIFGTMTVSHRDLGGLLPLGLALALTAAAQWGALDRLRTSEPLADPPRAAVLSALAAAVILNGYVCFSFLGGFTGFHYDTAEHSLRILDLIGRMQLDGRLKVIRHHGNPHEIIVASIVEWFGIGLVQLRAVAAVQCFLVMPVLYLLLRKMFNRGVACYGAVMGSASLWLFTMSKLVHFAAPVPLMAVLTFYLLYLYWVRSRWQMVLPALFGTVVISLTVYEAYRVVFLSIGCQLVYFALKKRTRVRAILLAAVLTGSFLTYQHFFDRWFWSRVTGAGLLASPAERLKQLHTYASIFFGKLFYGTYDIELSISQGGLDHPLVVGLLLVGAAGCVAGFRSVNDLFLLSWLVPAVAAGVLFEGQWRRVTILIPLFSALTALPFALLAHYLHGSLGASSKLKRTVAFVAPLTLLAALAAFNVSRFADIQRGRTGGYYLSPNQIFCAELASELVSAGPVFVFTDQWAPFWNFANIIRGNPAGQFLYQRNILSAVEGHEPAMFTHIDEALRSHGRKTFFLVKEANYNLPALLRLDELTAAHPGCIRRIDLDHPEDSFRLYAFTGN